MDDVRTVAKRKSLIVDQYATTDLPLSSIIQRTPQESSSPVAVALLQLHECLQGRLLAGVAMKTAQEAHIEDADAELAILTLSHWAELACRIGRPSEAEALIRRIRSMVTPETHPAVAAASRFAESVMADVTGNKAERESILKGIAASLPSHSPRRKFYSWELALLLAQQGRGMEAQDEIKDLGWQCSERFKPSRLAIVRLVDAIETGRPIDAVQYVTQLASVPPAELQVGRISVRDYMRLLSLMQTGKVPTAPEPPGTDDQPPTWIQIVHCLLQRKKDEALNIARLEARKLLGSFLGTGFESFGLIRAELSAGHWEGAVRLLKMRHGRGNRHYLDSLFLARAERLAGNAALAARHFAEVTEQVKHYQAEGRLEFELKLSCELDEASAADLARQASDLAKSRPESTQAKEDASQTTKSGNETDGRNAGINAIVGKSTRINGLRDTILRFANINSPVLITGETGTGKELVARALHQAGRNRELPFNAVNCGAITETLLESELFGHERGAFTGADRANKGLFEATGRGTILLDEIGDISPRLQTALLRVLETGEIRAVGSSTTRKVHCRVLAATNADLNALVERGTFRKDLLYRLQRLEIHVPPLRERRDDVLSLARHFFDSGRDIGVHAVLSPKLVKALEGYDWPGNVRELRNVVERMRLMHSDKLTYDVDDLEVRLKTGQAVSTEQKPLVAPTPAPAPQPVESPAPAQPPAPAAPPATPQPENIHRSVQTPARIAMPRQTPLPPDAVGEFLRSGRSPMRRLDRIRDLFREHRRLTRAEVIALLGISPNTATKDLDALRAEGFITRVEPSASSRSFYFQIADTEH